MDLPVRTPTRRNRAERVLRVLDEEREEGGDEAAVEVLMGAFLAEQSRTYRKAKQEREA